MKVLLASSEGDQLGLHPLFPFLGALHPLVAKPFWFYRQWD